MENLNAEQIKNVLEHCTNWTAETGCKGCPYEDNCIDEDVTKDALALINSQEQDKEKLGLLIDEIEKEKRELFEENKRLTEENEAWQEQLITTEEDASKAYYDLACEVEDLRTENERLRAENEAAVDDLKNCMHYANPKNNNTCNFCLYDCESGMCKGREDRMKCHPVWRGVDEEKVED